MSICFEDCNNVNTILSVYGLKCPNVLTAINLMTIHPCQFLVSKSVTHKPEIGRLSVGMSVEIPIFL